MLSNVDLCWARPPLPYEFDGRPVPRAGGYRIVTDGVDAAVCVGQTIDVRIAPSIADHIVQPHSRKAWPDMVQRTRHPRIRSGCPLRSLGWPLNARPLCGFRALPSREGVRFHGSVGTSLH